MAISGTNNLKRSKRMSNEGKACDAVIRVLENRTSLTRTDVVRPEFDNSGSPLDFRLRLGKDSYAIEHSLIEAFDGQNFHGRAVRSLHWADN